MVTVAAEGVNTAEVLYLSFGVLVDCLPGRGYGFCRLFRVRSPRPLVGFRLRLEKHTALRDYPPPQRVRFVTAAAGNMKRGSSCAPRSYFA